MLLIAAVVSIAVAVGANTTIFSLANELMFAMPSAQRPHQLVHIQMGGGSHVSHLQWRQLEESGALGGLTGFNVEVSVNWQGPEQSISLMPNGRCRQLLRRHRRANQPRARASRRRKRRLNAIPRSP